MAKLYFYYASMNAGKSTTLLQADFNYRERGMATMLWTAAIDDRAEEQAIESRIGLGAGAHRFAPDTDLWARVTAAHRAEPIHCVLIDEAQFLTKDQVWQCARLADEAARGMRRRDVVEALVAIVSAGRLPLVDAGSAG